MFLCFIFHYDASSFLQHALCRLIKQKSVWNTCWLSTGADLRASGAACSSSRAVMTDRHSPPSVNTADGLGAAWQGVCFGVKGDKLDSWDGLMGCDQLSNELSNGRLKGRVAAGGSAITLTACLPACPPGSPTTPHGDMRGAAAASSGHRGRTSLHSGSWTLSVLMFLYEPLSCSISTIRLWSGCRLTWWSMLACFYTERTRYCKDVHHHCGVTLLGGFILPRWLAGRLVIQMHRAATRENAPASVARCEARSPELASKPRHDAASSAPPHR